MNESLKKIAGDSVLGSSDLLIKLAELYKSCLENLPQLKKLANDSERHFKSFALMTAYIKSVKKSLNSGNKEMIKQTVLSPLNRDYIYGQVFLTAVPYIKNINTVFTFSNSRTILEIFTMLNEYQKGKLKIFITESRPKYEGRILSVKLLEKNINVVFGTDALMTDFISKSDAVFLGADKIFKDGSITNKTGSLAAAITASYFKKPVYVFAESGKISASFKKEEKNPGEVWKENHPRLKIKNTYFEKVPSNLISKLFTENNL